MSSISNNQNTEKDKTFDIKFDYRFDELNLFTNKRKAVLEDAAAIWSSYIQDEFSTIKRGETAYIFINGILEEVTIDESIDDLLIFVYFTEINDPEILAQAGYNVSDSYFDKSDRQQRIDGEDFEPWLGNIEFNLSYLDEFYFDSNPETDSDIPRRKQDFLSLSLHEIGHVLGIGTSDSFANQIKNGKFAGTQSVALNDGDLIPLDGTFGHAQEGFNIDSKQDALLTPLSDYGERRLPSALDLAMLADIGYEIAQVAPEIEPQINVEITEDIVPVEYNITSVHRFFQYERGFHFYTADENERQNVVERSSNGALKYNYENVAYSVLASDENGLTGAKISDALPVYRFFNTDTGAHLYTMDENEKDAIVETLDNYNFEGAAYYAFAMKPEIFETIPLYRMLNTQSGSHLFTTDSNEFNTIQQTLPYFQPEGNAGITFYVLD